jgi:general stress protein 26
VNPGEAGLSFLKPVGIGTPFLCSLATLEPSGAPTVRFVRAKADNDATLRIPTFANTDKVLQIRADSRVHVT